MAYKVKCTATSVFGYTDKITLPGIFETKEEAERYVKWHKKHSNAYSKFKIVKVK
jgi:hypothetical protein